MYETKTGKESRKYKTYHKALSDYAKAKQRLLMIGILPNEVEYDRSENSTRSD